jgi:hypothetical protein
MAKSKDREEIVHERFTKFKTYERVFWNVEKDNKNEKDYLHFVFTSLQSVTCYTLYNGSGSGCSP